MVERREEILRKMRKKVREAYRTRDMLLVYGEGTASEIEKAINVLFERLDEWYSIYFPELKLENREKYCKLVLAIEKERLDESRKKIAEIMGEKGKVIESKLETSAGIDLMEKDLEALRKIASEILDLIRLEEDTERYNEIIAREVCPNLVEVGGPKIAAKLIAHVGGLQKLARLPASTIQVLGAEKALFKHLRKKTKPPKHGIIFQHASIHSAPKKLRGKLSRALATTLSIAVKVDAYGNRFIGKELRNKFEKRVEKIMKARKEGKEGKERKEGKEGRK